MSEAQEVPFTSAMEHPEPAHDTTIRVGRNLWTLHGMTHRILESLGMVQSRALSLAERGPEDYAESDFERGMKAGAQYGGYREAPKHPKNEGSLKTIIVGCTITLLSAVVIGAWKLSNDSAALRAELTEWKQATTRWMDASDRRMERLENRRQ
jgi:hypothetical protein